jgi:nucleotide-binding universal stress UspA family protein
VNKNRIVVGYDGSEGSLRALRWAMEEARTRGATLQVIHTWHYPYVGDYLTLTDTAFRDTEKLAQQTLQGALTEASEVPDLQVTGEARQGPAAGLLIDAASDADLLVVGSRGHGGFGGLLLGSVSMQCAHHAPCPVVIVPPPPT